jgi:ABC-type lipoprotein release transport system permease subunit
MAAVTTMRIAWRNLGRNRKRSVLSIGAIAVGQFAFLAVAALLNGYSDDFVDTITGPLVGHIQIHAPGWREDRSTDLVIEDVDTVLSEIRSDPAILNASARIYAPVLAALTQDGFMGVVVGVEATAESHADGLLPGGVGDSLGEGRALVGRGFARKHGIGPGDELALVGQDVYGSIASGLFAVADSIRSPVELVNGHGVVMSLGDARDLLGMGTEAHEIIVHVRDMDAIDAAVARLSSLPSLTGYEVLSWREVVPQLVAMANVMDGFLMIILGVVFIAAAAGIANTMLMSTFERSHEFGMLLSLGCGPGRLAGMITVEAVMLGLIGVGAGTALGMILYAVTSVTGLDYAALGGSASYEVAFQGLQLSTLVHPKLYAADVAAGLTAVFLTSLVSVVWPIARIVRLEPMEAMRS